MVNAEERAELYNMRRNIENSKNEQVSLSGRKKFLTGMLKLKHNPIKVVRENTERDCKFEKGDSFCRRGITEEYKIWVKRKQTSVKQIEIRQEKVEREIKKERKKLIENEENLEKRYKELGF